MTIYINFRGFKKHQFSVVVNDDKVLLVNVFGIALLVKKGRIR